MVGKLMHLGTVTNLLGSDAVDFDDPQALEGADVVIVGRRWSTALRAGPAHSAALRPSGRPATSLGSLHGHRQSMSRLIESGARHGDRFPQKGLDGYWPGLSEITTFLANRVWTEALSGLAATKGGITHNPAGPLIEGLR